MATGLVRVVRSLRSSVFEEVPFEKLGYPWLNPGPILVKEHQASMTFLGFLIESECVGIDPSVFRNLAPERRYVADLEEDLSIPHYGVVVYKGYLNYVGNFTAGTVRDLVAQTGIGKVDLITSSLEDACLLKEAITLHYQKLVARRLTNSRAMPRGYNISWTDSKGRPRYTTCAWYGIDERLESCRVEPLNFLKGSDLV